MKIRQFNQFISVGIAIAGVACGLLLVHVLEEERWIPGEVRDGLSASARAEVNLPTNPSTGEVAGVEPLQTEAGTKSVEMMTDDNPAAILRRVIEVRPMPEAGPYENLEVRFRRGEDGRTRVDSVWTSPDLEWPVRLTSRLEYNESGGLSDVVREDAAIADELMVMTSNVPRLLEGLEAMAGTVELLGEMAEMGIVRVGLPLMKLGEMDALLENTLAIAGVEMASFHDLVFPAAAPDDPDYGGQSHLHKIDPEGAWKLMPEGAVTPSGRRVVLATADSGNDMFHPDFDFWTNPNEVLDGTDTDGNLYIDDLHGYCFVSLTNNIHYPSGHGQTVARIAASVTNNGIGGASPAGRVQLMTVRAFTSGQSGSLFSALDSVRYSIIMGASVVNCSFVGGGANWWHHYANFAQDRNVLIVAAAGNGSKDLDEDPSGALPGSFIHPNILTVGSSNLSDVRNSNYGSKTVDVFAPGTATSWSTPLVASSAALLYALRDDMTAAEVRQLLIDGVDQSPSLEGACVSGGRINLTRSVQLGLAAAGEGTEPDNPEEPWPGDEEENTDVEGGTTTLKGWFLAQGYPEDFDASQGCERWGGIPLAMVYAFGLDEAGEGEGSLQPAGESGAEQVFPQLPRVIGNGSPNAAEFVFWRNTATSDVRLRVESSSDLVHWEPALVLEPDVSSQDIGGLIVEKVTERLERLSLAAFDGEKNRSFWRVTMEITD